MKKKTRAWIAFDSIQCFGIYIMSFFVTLEDIYLAPSSTTAIRVLMAAKFCNCRAAFEIQKYTTYRFWTPRRAKVAFRVSVSRLRKIRALPCGCYAHDFAKTHRRRALPPPLNKHAIGGGAAPCYVSRQHAALAIRPPAPINIRGTNAPFHTRRGQLDQTPIPLASLLA